MTITLHIIYVLIFINSITSTQLDSDWEHRNLKSSCKRHRECSDPKFAYCLKGKCECLPNYRWRPPFSCQGNLNANCDIDHDCADNGPEDIKISCIFNKCTNYTNFITSASPEEKERYRATIINSRCETDNHCSGIRNSVCRSGKCLCAPNYWLDYNEYWIGFCRPITNKPCNVSSDCREEIDTKCFLNVCMIPEDFFVDSNAHNISLYAAKKVNDFCRTNDECSDVENSYCKDKSCTCLPGFANIDNKCVNFLGLPCKYYFDCSYESGLECIADKCVIPEEFFSSPAANSYLAKGIGYDCRINDHCSHLENSYCNGERCTCSEGYRYDGSKCVSQYPSCGENEWNCWFKEKCFDGVCYRPSDYLKTSNSSQYVAQSLEDDCGTDYHCRKFNNSVCLRGYCKCKDGYENRNGTCHELITLKCEKNSDCVKWNYEGFYCFLGECLRPEKFFTESNAKNMSLYIAKDVHAPCQTDKQCSNLDNTHCFGNICDCLPDHEFLGDRNECRKMVNVSCNQDDDCLIPRTFCFFNKCLYPEQFLDPSNGYKIEEYATERLGSEGYCQTHQHCRYLPNSMCYTKQCLCQNYYAQEGNRCVYNPLIVYHTRIYFS